MMRPRFADDWPALAKAANHLLALRVAQYPPLVAAAKLSEADAADGIRTARALAMIWNAVIEQTPVPPIDASHSEIAAMLADIASRPDAAKARFTARYGRDYMDVIAALAYHALPIPGHSSPRIIFVHAINIALREQRDARVPDERIAA